MWAAPDLRPCKVMVWLPAHTGKFLDFIEGERLFALFSLAAYCGLRRDEVVGLTWAEVDLDEGVAFVRETGGGDGPKSESGVRVVPLPASRGAGTEGLAGAAGRRPARLGPRLAGHGPRLHPRGRDSRSRASGCSVRFETLAYRAGLPPVRFHDLRHGAASLARRPGSTRSTSRAARPLPDSFTDATYVMLFPEVAKAAAEAAAAIVPRAGQV